MERRCNQTADHMENIIDKTKNMEPPFDFTDIYRFPLVLCNES